MALHQKKIKFRLAFVDIMKEQQYKDKFLSMNPRGEVPVLVDGGVRTIPGSDVIIGYLDDNFANGMTKG